MAKQKRTTGLIYVSLAHANQLPLLIMSLTRVSSTITTTRLQTLLCCHPTKCIRALKP